ncbi:MAG: hypothetical protein J6X78_03330 [Treponema sp.]|nr:hypothetical protein [Treponema sp.]
MKRQFLRNKNIYSVILSLAMLFSVISCGNMNGTLSGKDNPSKTEKTYLCIRVNSVQLGQKSLRSINPDISEETQDYANKLTDFVLTGKFGDEQTVQTLLEAADVSELPEDGIEILAGNWAFTLNAKLNGINFSCTKTVEIIAGQQNTVVFKLSATEHFGGFNVTFNLDGSDVTKVIGELYAPDDTTAIDEYSFEIDPEEEDKAVVIKRDITNAEKRLASGSYRLNLEFFGGSEGNIPVNNWENYIAVVDGIMTTATIALNYNEIFTITYEGLTNTDVLQKNIPVTEYSVRSSFELPEYKRYGKNFLGWFETDSAGTLADTPTTEIRAGTTGNKVFTACFESPELYVTATGNDTTGDGSQANPLKTIDGACAAIEETGEEGFDWTIYVTGEITGIPLGTSGNAAIYGPSVIPETITSENAKSILITGTTDLDEDGIPADSINRGGSRTSGGPDGNGTVLTIKTAVPVTITNLKITGGDEWGQNAGGMTIAQGATVSLGDGALVTRNKNTSNGRGGGIHNEGTLYVYGSAVIGDKTNGGKENQSAYAYAKDSSSPTDFNNNLMSNYASSGGGIFNGKYADSSVHAKLYLGYKPDSNGTPVKQTLTGGLYYNSGSSGAALYNAAGSVVEFDSGNFSWNGTTGSGAAIYNDTNAEFTMSGGSIINNGAVDYGGAIGGGVYNSGKFTMSSGTINKCKAEDNYQGSQTALGGAVYNTGTFFMSGEAVIGDKDATELPTSSSWGNKAQAGAAIYNSGRVYLGYSGFASDGTTLVKAELKGGIYYNYSCNASGTNASYEKGGGVFYNSGTIKMDSGTIAYNVTESRGGVVYSTSTTNCLEFTGGTIKNNKAADKGSAFYINSSNSFTLDIAGSLVIPAETDTHENHDIYLACSDTYYTKVNILSKLADDFTIKLTPATYAPTMVLLKLNSTDVNTSLEAESPKILIADQVNETLGTTTQWYIADDGKLTSREPLGTITISIEQETFSDISVTSRYYNETQYASYTPGSKTGGTTLYASNTMEAGKKFVFTAPEAPADHTYTYEWYLDGQSKSPLAVPNGEGTDTYNHVLVLDSTDWIPGTYDLLLIIKDSYTEDSETKTDYYSYEMHIKVRAAQQ